MLYALPGQADAKLQFKTRYDNPSSVTGWFRRASISTCGHATITGQKYNPGRTLHR